MNINVLYEDNHLIAVLKPAGVLSQGDRTGDMSIFEEVKNHLKEKYKKPGKVFLGLLHRLDRPVSGIMLFAKTSKGASRLSEQFRNHEIEKTYHAIVSGKPKKSRGVLTNFLIKDTKLKKGKEKSSGKEASLYYEVVRSNIKYSLLKIKINTGKFHQIRSQLSMVGFPILGDMKYGGNKWDDAKSPDGKAIEDPRRSRDIALCATGLSFTTATEYKRINLEASLPEEWEKYLSGH